MAAHTGPGIRGNVQAVTTSAAAIFSPVSYPRNVLIRNNHGTETVYLGGHTTAALTTANGYPLEAGEAISFVLAPLHEIYVIAAATSEVRFLEMDGLNIT